MFMEKKNRFEKLKKKTTDFFKGMVQRVLMFVALAYGCATNAMAQSGAASALDTVYTNLGTYITPITKIIYAIAALVGLVGAVRIYIKMQSGDQDVQKSIVMLAGGCIFLVAVAMALPLIFGQTAYSG